MKHGAASVGGLDLFREQLIKRSGVLQGRDPHRLLLGELGIRLDLQVPQSLGIDAQRCGEVEAMRSRERWWRRELLFALGTINAARRIALKLQ